MKPWIPVWIAVAAISVSPALAQSAKDVTGGLDFAKYELDQNRPEKAGEALRKAYAALKLLSSLEKRKVGKAAKELTTLLKKTDPNGKKLVDVQVKAAKDLHKLAKKYVKAGWHDTALAILLQAQALQPTLVAADLAAVRDKLSANVGKRFEKAGKNKDLLTWFHLGDRHGWNSSPWHFSNYGIMAPKTDKKGGRPLIVTKKKLEGSVRIDIELKPGPAAKAAFHWNYRRVLEGKRYIVNACFIELDTKSSSFEVIQIEDGNPQSMGSGTLIMDTFRTKWIPVRIEQNGKKVKITIPNNKPIEFEAAWKNKGHLGLSFLTQNRSDPQAQFQHLAIKHLD